MNTLVIILSTRVQCNRLEMEFLGVDGEINSSLLFFPEAIFIESAPESEFLRTGTQTLFGEAHGCARNEN